MISADDAVLILQGWREKSSKISIHILDLNSEQIDLNAIGFIRHIDPERGFLYLRERGVNDGTSFAVIDFSQATIDFEDVSESWSDDRRRANGFKPIHALRFDFKSGMRVILFEAPN